MTYETALLIIPPPPVQAFCYPWREQHDQESFIRVPAHITLLYPFVPPEIVDEAVTQLEQICADTLPFEVVLSKYGQFEGALFLEPENPNLILNLFHKIAEAFPEYSISEDKHGGEFHPHLTLAQSDDPGALEKINLPPEPHFAFTVNKIHLYLGSPDDDIPYVPRAVIPFRDA
jgi:2'-5' RNA ligase